MLSSARPGDQRSQELHTAPDRPYKAKHGS
jgi:hypothetical protein